ncbi:hypothetical protein PLESTM_001916300 [Pleodorina starrii]|nr:hypothetical protein PLESTM_001916300 [Pleodorina starrii]
MDGTQFTPRDSFTLAAMMSGIYVYVKRLIDYVLGVSQRLFGVECPEDGLALGRERTTSEDVVKELLQTRKWKLLMDWCGWHARDQFGYEQPSVNAIVGAKHGRSILGGVERPHEYQVAISFPGAAFVKGELGSYSNLTDADGHVIANNGAEMAEALRHWLVEDWLDGDEQRGLTHVFIDKCNLMYCEGSVLAEGFGKKDSKTAVAVLNENWAIYLREAFLEARCVVFLVNQDWMDSVPCNLEFEGLIKKKMNFRDGGERQAVIFLDITRTTYSLPTISQYLATMREMAARCFNVHSFEYNDSMSADEKRTVRCGLRDLVSRYCTKFDLPDDFELKVMAEKRLNWSNWIYYGALNGTNGWRTMIEAEKFNWEALKAQGGNVIQGDRIHATFIVKEPFPSRRFRMRVTRLFDGMWGELQVISLGLYEHETGMNIMDFGKGYIKARGELTGVHPATGILESVDNKWVDKCGNRQYSWLEWLVPDAHLPVTVDKVILAVDRNTEGHERPVDFVFEAMTVEAWPQNGSLVQQGYVVPREFESMYDFFPDQGDAVTPKWVQLHAVYGAALEPGAGTTFEVPADKAALACSQYRIRFLEVAGAEEARSLLLPGLELKVCYPSAPSDQPILDDGRAVYPVGGGLVTGSGGQEQMEDSGPAYAFNDHKESRWIDPVGGGIDGQAWWQYNHSEPVTVIEYGIKSSINTMGFYDLQHGAPRDWVLKAQAEDGGWVVVDKQEEVYFSDFRQLKRFRVVEPMASKTYRLEFSAVRCGCASAGLVVGDIYLLASLDDKAKPDGQLQPLCMHQAWATPSASSMERPQDTVTWVSPSRMHLNIPLFPMDSKLLAVNGGTARWQDMTLPWYDAPMEFPLTPRPLMPACESAAQQVAAEDAGGSSERGQMWSCTGTLCGRPYTRFRVDFPDGEITLGYTADRPMLLAAYSLQTGDRYQRGDPRSWRLEAQQDEDGAWHVLHMVNDFVFERLLQTLTVYLPDNGLRTKDYRLVITRMHAPSPHIGVNLGFYSSAADEAAVVQRTKDMLFKPSELACVEVTMRPREGKRMLGAYTMVAADGLPPGTPSSWVVEGLTSSQHV